MAVALLARPQSSDHAIPRTVRAHPTELPPNHRRQRPSGQITIASGFESGWDFVTLLGLGGGMPTRVTVPEGRLDEVVAAIQSAPAPVPRHGARPEE